MKKLIPLVALLGLLAAPLQAAVVVHDITDITVSDQVLTEANTRAGVWLNFFTGEAIQITDTAYTPDPRWVDGTFQFARITSFAPDAAQIYTQGLFANGNNVLGAGWTNTADGDTTEDNVARLAVGETFGAATFDNAFYPDMAGLFGEWNAFGRGFVGVSIANSGDVHYGFIDVTVNPDYTVTVHGFAYESLSDTDITTFVIPEPSTYAMIVAGFLAVGFVALRRRR